MFAVMPKRILENLRSEISSGYLIIRLGYSKQSLVNDNITSNVKDYEKSFTVSYPIESCGLSRTNAMLASEKIQLKTPERPDSVLKLFKKQGFSSTHISKVVKKLPSLLLAKEPDKTLLPKFEFLRSIGLSGNDVTKILIMNPTLLKRSLENQIIPSYNFLKAIVETDERIRRCFRQSTRVLGSNLQTNIIPNLSLLRELEVPQSSLVLLVSHYPDAAFMPNKKFVEIVEEVKRMGFDPHKSMFVQAIQVFYGKGRETIGKKFEKYMQWGLSEDEALMAFRRQPHIMVLSDQRIQRTMDFLINKMGWSPAVIAKYPVVLCLSLEKRVIPRCSVFQVLVSRNLVKQDMSIGTLMTPDEETFVKRYVTKFLGASPQLLDVYQGKIDPSTLVNDSGPSGDLK